MGREVLSPDNSENSSFSNEATIKREQAKRFYEEQWEKQQELMGGNLELNPDQTQKREKQEIIEFPLDDLKDDNFKRFIRGYSYFENTNQQNNHRKIIESLDKPDELKFLLSFIEGFDFLKQVHRSFNQAKELIFNLKKDFQKKYGQISVTQEDKIKQEIEDMAMKKPYQIEMRLEDLKELLEKEAIINTLENKVQEKRDLEKKKIVLDIAKRRTGIFRWFRKETQTEKEAIKELKNTYDLDLKDVKKEVRKVNSEIKKEEYKIDNKMIESLKQDAYLFEKSIFEKFKFPKEIPLEKKIKIEESQEFEKEEIISKELLEFEKKIKKDIFYVREWIKQLELTKTLIKEEELEIDKDKYLKDYSLKILEINKKLQQPLNEKEKGFLILLIKECDKIIQEIKQFYDKEVVKGTEESQPVEKKLLDKINLLFEKFFSGNRTLTDMYDVITLEKDIKELFECYPVPRDFYPLIFHQIENKLNHLEKDPAYQPSQALAILARELVRRLKKGIKQAN